MNEKDLQQAQEVFAIVKGALDDNEWTYDCDEDKMIISCSSQGEDLPIDINIHVDADRQMIIFTSQIPVTFPEDKIVEAAVAVAEINTHLVDGSFDLNIGTGKVYFRLTGCFLDSLITRTFFDYIMITSIRTVDDFNDKLLMLAKGMMDLKEFGGLFEQVDSEENG
ncbi:MAG: YbjN domain-containing protein [Ruminococcus sp.]|nr:YbjN domain-containing protein [Ruminococcus sp.]